MSVAGAAHTCVYECSRYLSIVFVGGLHEAWMAYVLRAFHLCPGSEHTAARAGSHNGGAGRLADAPLEFEVGGRAAKKYANK